MSSVGGGRLAVVVHPTSGSAAVLLSGRVLLLWVLCRVLRLGWVLVGSIHTIRRNPVSYSLWASTASECPLGVYEVYLTLQLPPLVTSVKAPYDDRYNENEEDSNWRVEGKHHVCEEDRNPH